MERIWRCFQGNIDFFLQQIFRGECYDMRKVVSLLALTYVTGGEQGTRQPVMRLHGGGSAWDSGFLVPPLIRNVKMGMREDVSGCRESADGGPKNMGVAAAALTAALTHSAGLVRLGFGAIFFLSLFVRSREPLAFAPVASPQPFFDGWFIRLTDVEAKLSCAVIVGSLRHAGYDTLAPTQMR